MVATTLNKQTARGGIQIADWLTVERAAYAGIAVLALGLRLYGLGQTPLGPAEVAQALPAWAAAGGQPYAAGSTVLSGALAGISPLLYSLQRVLFTFFGATDFTARFWPALISGLAPLLFYALRGRLTRGGALAAALMWAISPVAVFAGRQGLGESLVAPLALALLAALATWGHGDAENIAGAPGHRIAPSLRLGLVAAALGLLLISGSGAYTAVLAGLLAAIWWPGSLPALWAQAKAHRREVLIGLLAPLVLGATFLLTVPAGLAAAGDLLAAWLKGWWPVGGDYGAWEVFRRLLISEPWAVGLGIAGLVGALRRKDRFGAWAAMAGAVALLVSLFGRGRNPMDLALVVLALALLGGPVVARVLRAIPSWCDQSDPWLLIALSSALLISALFCLPSAWNLSNTTDWRQLYAAVGIATVTLAALVWIVYGVFGSWRTVAQVLPIVALVFGLAWNVGQVTALSYDRGAWRQAAMLDEVPAPDLANLMAVAHNISALNGGGAQDGRVDVAWPERPGDPVLAMLRWQLRDIATVRVDASVPMDPAPIVITPVEDQPSLKDRYSGAEFPVLERWQPVGLGDFNAYLRWVLYREAKTAPETQKVIVWIDRTVK